MRSDLFRRVAWCFVILQGLALLAIALGELVPDDRVLDQLDRAVASGDLRNVNTERQDSGGIADRFGECVTATVGVGGAEYSWVESIVLSPNLGPCPAMIDQLDGRSVGEALQPTAKVRYWNGLSVISRPLVAVLGVVGARVAAGVALAACALWLAAAVANATDRLVAIALLGPLVALTDPAGLVGVYHHPLMVAVGLAGAAVLVRRSAAGAGPRDLALLAFAAASVYSFFDLMNFVVGMWTVTSVLVGLAVPRSADLRRLGRSVVAVFVAWPAGYVSMWIGKWVWAALIRSPGVVWDEIRGQVEFRINGSSQYATGEFGAGLRANLAFWRAQGLGTSLIVALLVAGAFLLARAWRQGSDLRRLVVVLGPVLVLVPWYLLTNNHNEIHYWFEYRSLGLVLAAACAVSVAAARGRFRPIER